MKVAKQKTPSKAIQKKSVVKAAPAKPVAGRPKPAPVLKKPAETVIQTSPSPIHAGKNLPKNNDVAKTSKPRPKMVSVEQQPAIEAAPIKRASKNGQSNKPIPIIKPRKTNLDPAELEEFRGLLLEKRGELIGDVTHLQNEAMGQGSSGETSGSSSMPIHMADLGSDTWEQELTLGLIENERGLLREIDEALARIEDRTYGICMATNKPITKSRLRAKPWAKHCIEYERKRELGLA
jgi:RNA polymerase-binding transcription factor DksA